MNMLILQAMLGAFVGLLALSAVVARRQGARHLDAVLSQPFMLVERPASVLASRIGALGQAIDRRREATRTWLFRGALGVPIVILAVILTPVWLFLVKGLWEMDRDVFSKLGQGTHASFIAAGVVAVTLLLGLILFDVVGVWQVLPFHFSTRRARLIGLAVVVLLFVGLVGVYHSKLALTRAYEDKESELAVITEKEVAAEQLEATINEGLPESERVDLTSQFEHQREAAEKRYEFNRTGNVVQAFLLSGGEMLLSPAPFITLVWLSLLVLSLLSVVLGFFRLMLRGVVFATERVFGLTRGLVLTLVRRDGEMLDGSSARPTASTAQVSPGAPVPPVVPSGGTTPTPVVPPAPRSPSPTAPSANGPAHGSNPAPWDDSAAPWRPPTPLPAI